MKILTDGLEGFFEKGGWISWVLKVMMKVTLKKWKNKKRAMLLSHQTYALRNRVMTRITQNIQITARVKWKSYQFQKGQERTGRIQWERQLRQTTNAVTSKMNMLLQTRKEKGSLLVVTNIVTETDTLQTTKRRAIVPVTRTTARAAANPMINAVHQILEISTVMLFLPSVSLCYLHVLGDTFRCSFHGGLLSLPLASCLGMPLLITRVTWVSLRRQDG
jgi:hypothetical protein